MPPANNKSIHDFFKPSQPAPKPANPPASQPSSNPRIPSSRPATKPPIASKSTISPFAMGQAKSTISTTLDQPRSSVTSKAPDQAKSSVVPPTQDQRGYTSSLSPPPTSKQSLSSVSPPPASEPSSRTVSASPASELSPPATEQSPSLVLPPQKKNIPLKSVLSNTSYDRVIQNSDDEGEDSDSSLEDLSALLAAKSSEVRARQAANGITPSTPKVSKNPARSVNFHVSPLPVLTKYKFDLKSLVSRAEEHEASEASSKRVKAMMAAKDEDDDTAMSDHAAELSKFPHDALLGSVVADREDLEAHKVTRAIMRTEATVTDKRWYFFDTKSNAPKPQRAPFPTKAVPQNWKKELVDPKMRYQTFISSFAENMVTFGKKLPDELFLWVLDEACMEANDPLRTSYLNTIRESREQTHRLLNPDSIIKIFRALGGSSVGTEINQKVVPVSKLADPYSNRDWSSLLSFINFFGQISRLLKQRTRTTIICMLLRMSVDHVVFENVDVLDSVQGTISRLCKHTPGEEWETLCQEICRPLFESIEQATLRLKIIDSISSTTARTHDLRRRLAMCFYFKDLSFSKNHSHSIMDLNVFIRRLDDPDFDANSQTDYRELTALILLLDTAVDDGRSMNLDLSVPSIEKKFDEDIEDFGATIKDVMRSIGNPGAAFISRIEAKEVLELVSQRISDTLRSKPKPKNSLFDKAKPAENLESERKGMRSFISRVQEISSNGQASK